MSFLTQNGNVDNANSRTVLIGDSITLYGVVFRSETRNIFQHCNRVLGQPFNVVNVAGYSGFTTEQILNQWNSAVAPFSPAMIVWESTINDIRFGQTAEISFLAVKKAHIRAKLSKIRFVFYTTAYPLPIASQAIERAKLLNMLSQYAVSDSTFEYVDCVTSGLEFNTNKANLASGLAIAGFVPDDIHPAAIYCRVMSNALIRHFQNRGYPGYPIFSPIGLDNNNGDTTNLFENGLVGDTASLWINNIIGDRSPVSSVVPNSNVGIQTNLPGTFSRTVFSPGASAVNTDFMGRGQNISLDLSNRRGDKYRGKMFISASSVGGVLHTVGLRFGCFKSDFSELYWEVYDNWCADPNDINFSIQTNTYDGVFVTEEITVPQQAGASFMFLIGFAQAESGAVVTMDCGCAEIRLSE